MTIAPAPGMLHTMSLRRVLALTIAAAALASCSSGTSGAGGTRPGAPGAPPSSVGPVAPGAGPCAYVTEQAAGRFGEHSSYPGRREDELSFGPSCDYGAAVFTLVTKDVSEAAFVDGTTKRVAGLGDRAYYGAEYHWLHVAKGPMRFEIRCRFCPDPELPTMIAVARSVLARIP